jgi:uncharacterized RDD family membrane protein YckC
VSHAFSLSLNKLDAIGGQLLGFTTLTLPVMLYFTLSEHSRHAATIGKRKFHVQVLSIKNTKAGFGQLLLRNCIKFLPWELAHYFVFHLFPYVRQNTQPPNWIMIGLILAQCISIVYLLSMVFSKSNRGIYEKLSQTKTVQNKL